MPVVRVKLPKDKKTDEPFHPGFPTFREILTLPDEGVMYIHVPAEDMPVYEGHPEDHYIQSTHGPILVKLPDDKHDELHDHLDKRYQERSGEFRPEIG
jgi:hypothetical protein